MEEKKEHHSHEHSEHRQSRNSTLESVRKNPWIIVSVVLAVILIVVLIMNNLGGSGDVGSNKASGNLVNYINSLGKGDATLVNTTKDSGMYLVNVGFQNQTIPVYVSLDGQYLIPDRIPLSTTPAAAAKATTAQTAQQPKDVPKSDKPVADFFVFAYCPYGTQMEKALVPVYNLLKDKAQINIVFIGAMHGEFEHVESLRQICINKNYGEDKWFAYLDKFLVNSAIGSCQGTDSCVNPLIETIFTQIGVDKTKINSCMASDAEAIYQANEKQAQAAGIGSSPTVTVNGVQVSMGRSPALVQQGICSAFNSAPSECSQTLSSTSASPGFGSTASSGSAASCG